MRTKTVFEYIGYGLIIGAFVILVTPDLRSKAFGLFKSKPYVELTDSTPYELNITEFHWSYGLTAINQFNGDFNKLDEKVYNLLKGKAGMCKVNLQSTGKDKYGKPDATMLYIGDININELSKYQDWKYWQGEAGIRKLLHSYFNRSSLDSVRTDTASHSPNLATPIAQSQDNQPESKPKVYGFSTNMLYPIEADRNRFDPNQFIVDGIITEANFDNGAMRIRVSNGDEIDVQFYPLDASSAVQNDMRLAVKVGNKVSSICARAGATTMDLISAEITER